MNKMFGKRKRDLSDDDTVNTKRCCQYSFFKTESDTIYTVGTEIHFNSEINRISIAQLIKEITKLIKDHKNKYVDTENKLQIVYIVDSLGGHCTSVLKFVDFIKIQKKKNPFIEFISIATGLVASAGTIMCSVADKRLMTGNAYAMIHELSSGNNGSYSHLLSYTNHLTNLHDTLTNIYLEKCKVSKDELETLLKNETWFTAKQYLEYGFIDEIIA